MKKTDKSFSFGDKVTLCEDGKYRWKYSLNLFKNYSVFFLVWKIFFFIFAAIFVVMTVADASRFDDFYPDRLVGNLKFSLYFIIGMTVISLLGYLIYAARMGGKYTVEFEMDEKGILHRQTPAQAKKARQLGGMTAALGAATGNLTAAGVGMNAQRTEMYSDFSRVKKVKGYPSRGLIKVNETLSHNQVYVQKEDFEFVKNYIISHCESIKK